MVARLPCRDRQLMFIAPADLRLPIRSTLTCSPGLIAPATEQVPAVLVRQRLAVETRDPSAIYHSGWRSSFPLSIGLSRYALKTLRTTWQERDLMFA